MEIKNIQLIPEHKREQYLDNLSQSARNQSEFKLRIIAGKTSREDLAALLEAARGSRHYQAHRGNYQFRLKSDSEGNQTLSLKEQGLWSRFKGVFGLGAERREQERTDALRYIESLVGVGGEKALDALDSMSRYKQFGALGDQSVVDHVQTFGGNPKMTFQSAKAFQEGLLQRYEGALRVADDEQARALFDELKAVVKKEYGFVAVAKLAAELVENNAEGSRLKTDKQSVRTALRNLELEFGTRADAPKHPQVLSVAKQPAKAEMLADLKATWGAVNDYPKEGGLFPEQCLKDINRQWARIENGALVAQQGSPKVVSPNYLSEQKEKYIEFFESATGLGRDTANFQNMFRNFIRNFNQNADITHANYFLLHGLSAGYKPDNFILENGSPIGGHMMTSDGENITIKRQFEINMYLRNENIPLVGVATEEFKIPIASLNTNETAFDLSSVALEPKRTYSVRMVPPENRDPKMST